MQPIQVVVSGMIWTRPLCRLAVLNDTSTRRAILPVASLHDGQAGEHRPAGFAAGCTPLQDAFFTRHQWFCPRVPRSSGMIIILLHLPPLVPVCAACTTSTAVSRHSALSHLARRSHHLPALMDKVQLTCLGKPSDLISIPSQAPPHNPAGYTISNMRHTL